MKKKRQNDGRSRSMKRFRGDELRMNCARRKRKAAGGAGGEWDTVSVKNKRWNVPRRKKNERKKKEERERVETSLGGLDE